MTFWSASLFFNGDFFATSIAVTADEPEVIAAVHHFLKTDDTGWDQFLTRNSQLNHSVLIARRVRQLLDFEG
jgi:hypothetical protein